MNSVSLTPRGAVCEGCLSVDRKLSFVADDKGKRMFCEFLNEMDVNRPVLVCWECAAMMRRTLRFKDQVQRAHWILSQQQPIQAASLSMLGISSRSTVLECRHAGPSPLDFVTFVKVEEEDLVDDHMSQGDFGASADDEDKQIVLKTDLNDDDKATEKPKARRLRRAKSTEGFSESDDEPLMMQKKEEKTSRRKKKETPAAPGAVRARREKPAGVVQNSRVQRKLEMLNVAPGQLEMVVLSWDEVETERQRALAGEAYARQPHRCEHCALGFNHRCKLDDHMRKHDPSAGPAECSACRVRCRDARALAAHRRRHRVRWRCRECGGMWSRAAVAADHAARAHAGNTPAHTCRVCGQRETSLGKLRNHLKSHSERQRCELCGKTFRDRASLRTHLFIHKGEKEYSCPRCDKRFLFKRAMEVHLVTHDASALLYCHQCDMNFKNRMSLSQHLKYNLKHVDPARLKHACHLCDKRFLKATRLEEHKLAVHLKLTPVRCAAPGCLFACSSRPVLRAHVRTAHRDARARRNHVCDVCGKAYTTKKSLEGHLRSHSGERPFRCARCPAAFGHEATLYNHTRRLHRDHKGTRERLNISPTAEGSSAALAWPAAAHIEQ